MPAHDSLSPQFGQSSRDAQRRERILSKSQSMLDDIDFTVDNKPYQPTEVEKSAEANNTKQWGPDPDPVSADHPTVHRFRYDHEPEMDGDFYRTHEQEGLGHGGYLTEYGNRSSSNRINLFGSTQFTPYRYNEIYIDEDGPLHGVARPIQDESQYSMHDRLQKASMYMSRSEKKATKNGDMSWAGRDYRREYDEYNEEVN